MKTTINRVSIILLIIFLANSTLSCDTNGDGEEEKFEIGFNKTILGDEYYVGSHIIRTVAELNTVVGEFGFTDVSEKYNESFFLSKSVLVFSYKISGIEGREITSISLKGSEIVIKYFIHYSPGPGSFFSQIRFLEVNKESVANATSIREEL